MCFGSVSSVLTEKHDMSNVIHLLEVSRFRITSEADPNHGWTRVCSPCSRLHVSRRTWERDRVTWHTCGKALSAVFCIPELTNAVNNPGKKDSPPSDADIRQKYTEIYTFIDSKIGINRMLIYLFSWRWRMRLNHVCCSYRKLEAAFSRKKACGFNMITCIYPSSCLHESLLMFCYRCDIQVKKVPYAEFKQTSCEPCLWLGTGQTSWKLRPLKDKRIANRWYTPFNSEIRRG